ncbi:MAG: tRNA (adenosine(37)-N6)-threonylcarbamoyltransferase complex ATPase subunit type 1 TsaE [Candidatus Aminicenantaceae bacterium]
MKNSKTIHMSASENETLELAKRLAESFQGQEVVFLTGELGAGKTVFAKGVASGLGLEDVNQVCSPSFTLVNIYQAKYPIYHIDLYRLRKNSEIEDLGWEDYLDRGVIIVEWAEKLKMELDAIRISIEVLNDETRKITIKQ